MFYNERASSRSRGALPQASPPPPPLGRPLRSKITPVEAVLRSCTCFEFGGKQENIVCSSVPSTKLLSAIERASARGLAAATNPYFYYYDTVVRLSHTGILLYRADQTTFAAKLSEHYLFDALGLGSGSSRGGVSASSPLRRAGSATTATATKRSAPQTNSPLNQSNSLPPEVSWDDIEDVREEPLNSDLTRIVFTFTAEACRNSGKTKPIGLAAYLAGFVLDVKSNIVAEAILETVKLMSVETFKEKHAACAELLEASMSRKNHPTHTQWRERERGERDDVGAAAYSSPPQSSHHRDYNASRDHYENDEHDPPVHRRDGGEHYEHDHRQQYYYDKQNVGQRPQSRATNGAAETLGPQTELPTGTPRSSVSVSSSLLASTTALAMFNGAPIPHALAAELRQLREREAAMRSEIAHEPPQIKPSSSRAGSSYFDEAGVGVGMTLRPPTGYPSGSVGSTASSSAYYPHHGEEGGGARSRSRSGSAPISAHAHRPSGQVPSHHQASGYYADAPRPPSSSHPYPYPYNPSSSPAASYNNMTARGPQGYKQQQQQQFQQQEYDEQRFVEERTEERGEAMVSSRSLNEDKEVGGVRSDGATVSVTPLRAFSAIPHNVSTDMTTMLIKQQVEDDAIRRAFADPVTVGGRGAGAPSATTPLISSRVASSMETEAIANDVSDLLRMLEREEAQGRHRANAQRERLAHTVGVGIVGSGLGGETRGHLAAPHHNNYNGYSTLSSDGLSTREERPKASTQQQQQQSVSSVEQREPEPKPATQSNTLVRENVVQSASKVPPSSSAETVSSSGGTTATVTPAPSDPKVKSPTTAAVVSDTELVPGEGWRAVVHKDTGKTYYVNKALNKTSWKLSDTNPVPLQKKQQENKEEEVQRTQETAKEAASSPAPVPAAKTAPPPPPAAKKAPPLPPTPKASPSAAVAVTVATVEPESASISGTSSPTIQVSSKAPPPPPPAKKAPPPPPPGKKAPPVVEESAIKPAENQNIAAAPSSSISGEEQASSPSSLPPPPPMKAPLPKKTVPPPPPPVKAPPPPPPAKKVAPAVPDTSSVEEAASSSVPPPAKTLPPPPPPAKAPPPPPPAKKTTPPPPPPMKAPPSKAASPPPPPTPSSPTRLSGGDDDEQPSSPAPTLSSASPSASPPSSPSGTAGKSVGGKIYGNFKEMIDPKTGRFYYCNMTTREVKWAMPPEVAQMKAAEEAAASGSTTSSSSAANPNPITVGPDGLRICGPWREKKTPEGRVYFVNAQTKASTWKIAETPFA